MSSFADHAFKDIYDLPKPWIDTEAIDKRAGDIRLLGLVATLLLVLQHFAADLRAGEFGWVGKPDAWRFYSPLMLWTWHAHFAALWHSRAGQALVIDNGALLGVGILLSFVMAKVLHKIGLSRATGVPHTYGSARVQTTREIERAEFFRKKGPAIGYTIDSRGRLRYVFTDAEGHILVVAPTGAGKTTAYVYHLLTTRKGSVFVFDIKGENYDHTAGYRASAEGMNSTCLRLSLSDSTPGNAHFNPLDVINIGTPSEYKDVEDVVEVLIDPEGKGGDSNTMSEGHFQTFASSLLIAGILYVKYKYPPEKQNLAQVLALFSDPQADNTLDILKRMRDEEHDPQGRYGWTDDYGRPTRKNKFIVGPAVDIILMSEEARSSMIATAKRYLKPYRNPMVAEATAFSDFDPLDLVNPRKNISLYLVVAPSSKDSLKPVTRLIINMIVKKLTARLPGAVDPERRLHLVLDEFDTLGRLPVFVDGVQFLRGYGVDCSIIVQGYNQLYGRYGQHEMITSACNTSVVFTPTDDETKERISKRLGAFTHREKVPAQGEKQKDSYRDFARQLLFPDEVGRIPMNRALAFVKGHRPMYLFKRYAHDDAELTYRTSVPPPVKVSDEVRALLEDENAPDAAAEYRVDAP